MILGKRIRQLREAKNLSQGDIEKRTGLLRVYISRVEHGHTVPSLETLERLAAALEVPLYRLFYEGDDVPPAATGSSPSAKENMGVRSYVFPITVEPDEDVWRAYVPELEAKGAATWGNTRDEAIKNIQEVAQMVIEELLEDGEPMPSTVTVSDRPVVAVTL